jgi:hypothetical protein
MTETSPPMTAATQSKRNMRDSEARGYPNKKAEGKHTQHPTLVFLCEEVFVEQLTPLCKM